MVFGTGVDGATYYSFLLRMWQVPSNDEYIWRIQLENVRTGEKCGFTSPEELATYLKQGITQEDKSSGEGR